jgi:hypothetical protein
MSEQENPTAPTTAAPTARGSRRALITGAAVVVLAIGGLLAFVIPNHGLGKAAGSPSDPEKTGCPSSAAPPQWAAAKVVVGEGQVNQTIPVHVGDTVDFRLPGNKFRWDYVPSSDRIIAMESPAGYYDSSLSDCVWRVQVNATGQTIITFDRRMLCPPGSSLICSDIVIGWRYVLNAQ